jgi:hypothetical protein
MPVKSLSYLALCAGLVMAPGATSGCVQKPPTSSASPVVTQVGRGERVSTGNEVYDEYFARVHELQTDLVLTEIDEQAALMPLAQTLGLLPTAARAHVLEKLGSLVPTLPRMQLVIHDAAETSVNVTLLPGEKPGPDTAQLVKALEQAASIEFKIAARLDKFPERANRLQALGQTLSQSIQHDFASLTPEHRVRMDNELNASLAVARTIGADALREKERTRKFVRDLRATLARK